ncbi:hypothetical protein CkaCkLH20_08417 [Colletotrichum karsti]|uniref:Uncharacterized protein n=1 Tax=Colletotrichum karsti TaxID=1095194 RepID=A0A9P6I8L8_9PEZI|nr:uncharacterized protein CkaCkLH20_08417 [Colletotrichum karsti]KAF9874045.1 hypothetical protein CkaCkLH20_08417 [Colletotrichum karsti]
MAPQCFDKKQFISRDDVLRYRAVTKFLSVTNGYGPSAPVGSPEQRKGPPYHLNQTLSPTQKAYVQTLHFTHLLVRQHEVVTTTMLENNEDILNAIRKLSIDNTGFPDPRQGPRRRQYLRWIRRYRRDDQTLSDLPTNALPGQLKCKLTNLDGTGFPANVSAARYYIDNIQATVKGAGGRTKLQTSVSWGKHVDNTVCLLRRMRLAKRMDDLRPAVKIFRNYVVISSCEKMNTRLFRGVKKSRVSGAIAALQQATTESLDVTEQLRMMENRRNFHLAITYDISAVKSDSAKESPVPAVHPLSAKDSDEVRNIVTFLKKSGHGQGLGSYPPPGKDWYNVEGRQVFHEILSRLLNGYTEALAMLIKTKNTCHKEKTAVLKGKQNAQGPDAQMLDRVATNVVFFLVHLSLFQDKFAKMVVIKGQEKSTVLHEHLQWVAERYRLEDDRHVGSKSPLYRAYDEDTVETKSGSGESHEIDSEKSELSDLDATSQRSWAAAAGKYLNLLTLHGQAMRNLGKFDVQAKDEAKKIASVIITKGGFRLLEVIPEYKDLEMVSMKDLLSIFPMKDGKPLQKKDQILIMNWIHYKEEKKNGAKHATDFRSSYFGGTCHCEVSLLCIQLLNRQMANLRKSSPQEGIEIPEKDIIDLFLKTITVLPVSKHCCPACDSLVAFYANLIGKQIQYPGSHKNWSACSPPPWILKDAGSHMMKIATEALRERLSWILEQINRKPTDPSPTPSSSEVKSPEGESMAGESDAESGLAEQSMLENSEYTVFDF